MSASAWVSGRRIVSSMFAFRPSAKEFSVPTTWKPSLCRTPSEPALSLAARVQRPGSAPARAAAPVLGWRCTGPGWEGDPVGDLSVAVGDEARDAAGKLAVAGHRPQDDLGRASHPGDVRVECVPVIRVRRGERSHAHRFRFIMRVILSSLGWVSAGRVAADLAAAAAGQLCGGVLGDVGAPAPPRCLAAGR